MLIINVFLSSKNIRKYEGIGSNSNIGTTHRGLNISVADPGFLSRIPDFFPYRITSPGTNNSKRRKEQNLLLTFTEAIKFHKIEN
jgi:hypothetical protein